MNTHKESRKDKKEMKDTIDLKTLQIVIRMAKNLPPLSSGQSVKDLFIKNLVILYKETTGIDLPRKGVKAMNDTFRKEYKPLTDDQKALMTEVKTKAEEIVELFNKIAPGEERSEKSRCVNLARTKLEETIMWAIKGLTA